MPELTAHEISLLKLRLAEAAASDRAEILRSRDSFLGFLERAGIFLVLDRFSQAASTAYDWLKEHVLVPLLDSL